MFMYDCVHIHVVWVFMQGASSADGPLVCARYFRSAWHLPGFLCRRGFGHILELVIMSCTFAKHSWQLFTFSLASLPPSLLSLSLSPSCPVDISSHLLSGACLVLRGLAVWLTFFPPQGSYCWIILTLFSLCCSTNSCVLLETALFLLGSTANHLNKLLGPHIWDKMTLRACRTTRGQFNLKDWCLRCFPR